MTTTYDERKFTELLVYVASRLQGDQSGGAIKFNKIRFFADLPMCDAPALPSRAPSTRSSNMVRPLVACALFEIG